MTQDKWLYNLTEVSRAHNDLVGKKCAFLGELSRLKINTPPGFAISVLGSKRFQRESGVGAEIKELIRDMASGLERVQGQLALARAIRKTLENRTLGGLMAEEVCQAYQRLCRELAEKDAAVAVRSSGAVSMPGQMDTYLNVRGEQEVLRKVVRVWASAFTARAIAYRLQEGLPLHRSYIGVAVLKMIQAKAAGVALTVLPNSGDHSQVMVEGTWGLGESLVSGEITPDQFVVDKATGRVVERIGRKTSMVVYAEGGTASRPVPAELARRSCLEAEELEEIVRVALLLEKHFQGPLDLEWVVSQEGEFPSNIYWVQARPAKVARPRTSDNEYLADLMSRVFSY